MKCLLILALAFSAPLTQVQARPDFSGIWVPVVAEPHGPSVETIRQDGGSITFIHPSEGEDHRQVYSLDGTETRNVIPSHGQEMIGIARTAWDGPRLVITESVRYPDGRILETRKTLSLDEKGYMTLEVQGTLNGKALPPVSVQYKRKAA